MFIARQLVSEISVRETIERLNTVSPTVEATN